MSGKNYTDEESRFIQDNYMDMTDKEIAAELGRPRGSVTNHRKNILGLTKYTRQEWNDEEVIKAFPGAKSYAARLYNTKQKYIDEGRWPE